MEFYDWYINNIYDRELVYDRIDREGGRGSLIGDKAAPYGVATIIIFVYGEGGDCIGIWWYLYVMNMRILLVYLYYLDYDNIIKKKEVMQL